jgi:hypothetical protein
MNDASLLQNMQLPLSHCKPVDILVLDQQRTELVQNATDLLVKLRTCDALLREATGSLLTVQNELGMIELEVCILEPHVEIKRVHSDVCLFKKQKATS